MVWMILAVFLVCAALMYTKKLSAILALPLMAVIIALLATPDKPLDAITLVFETGTARLAKAMTNVIFGAMLAHIVFTTGIAETIVKKAAELAGDRTLPVTIIMTMATAIAFLALAGLGSVVMMGTLVIPILLGVGLRPLAAAGIFLFGLSIGGMWNVANWGFYQDVLKLPLATISTFATVGGISLIVATLVYIVVNVRSPRVAWAAATTAPATAVISVPGISLLTPLIPVLLILGFKYANVLSGGYFASREFDINAALIIAALYGVLTTRPKEILNLLTGAFTEGIKTVAPVIALLIGIGMAVTALTADPVKAAMEPLLRAVAPNSPWGYVLFFGLLSPLALYRGPLNLYGLGAGVATVLAAILNPALVMGALMCTGMIQGVCDPTNTHNVWTGSLTKTDVNDILKATLPYAFAATVAALIVIALTRW
jgi:DcuC family C4-dicarboxylate transporter